MFLSFIGNSYSVNKTSFCRENPVVETLSCYLTLLCRAVVSGGGGGGGGGGPGWGRGGGGGGSKPSEARCTVLHFAHVGMDCPLSVCVSE